MNSLDKIIKNYCISNDSKLINIEDIQNFKLNDGYNIEQLQHFLINKSNNYIKKIIKDYYELTNNKINNIDINNINHLIMEFKLNKNYNMEQIKTYFLNDLKNIKVIYKSIDQVNEYINDINNIILNEFNTDKILQENICEICYQLTPLVEIDIPCRKIDDITGKVKCVSKTCIFCIIDNLSINHNIKCTLCRDTVPYNNNIIKINTLHINTIDKYIEEKYIKIYKKYFNSEIKLVQYSYLNKLYKTNNIYNLYSLLQKYIQKTFELFDEKLIKKINKRHYIYIDINPPPNEIIYDIISMIFSNYD